MRYLVVWRAALIEWSDSGDFKNLSRPRLRPASRSVDFRSAQQSIVLFDGRIPVQPPDGSEGGEAGKQEETRQQRSLNRPLHDVDVRSALTCGQDGDHRNACFKKDRNYQ